MKDTRFIELVNLYIDRQIEPADAAELEAVIQTDPGRRKIYNEYCRMHRATKLVYESFRTHAAQPAGAGKLPGTVEDFEVRRPRRFGWIVATAGLAAAACFAFVVVRQSAVQPAGSATAPQAVAVQKTTPAPVAVVTAPAASIEPAKVPVREADYAALLASMRREDQRAFALNQSASLQTVPLFDDGVFGPNRNVLNGSVRVFSNKTQVDSRPPSEFTAFQFQR